MENTPSTRLGCFAFLTGSARSCYSAPHESDPESRLLCPTCARRSEAKVHRPTVHPASGSCGWASGRTSRRHRGHGGSGIPARVIRGSPSYSLSSSRLATTAPDRPLTPTSVTSLSGSPTAPWEFVLAQFAVADTSACPPISTRTWPPHPLPYARRFEPVSSVAGDHQKYAIRWDTGGQECKGSDSQPWNFTAALGRGATITSSTTTPSGASRSMTTGCCSSSSSSKGRKLG